MQNPEIAKKIQEMRGVTLKIIDLKSSTSTERASPEGLIKYALMQSEKLSEHDASELAKSLVHNQDFRIQIGDKVTSAKDLREDILERIHNPINQDINHSWIDRAENVIDIMHQDSITGLPYRHNLLMDIGDRQAALRSMLDLYQTNALPSTKATIEKIKERIAQLEKIKTVVKKSTKEPEQVIQDPTINPQDIAKSKIYKSVLGHMKNNKKIPDNMKVKLELDSGVDFAYSIAEQAYKNQPNSSKDKILDRINQLRGRQQTNIVVNTKKEELRFDEQTYKKILEQQKQRT